MFPPVVCPPSVALVRMLHCWQRNCLGVACWLVPGLAGRVRLEDLAAICLPLLSEAPECSRVLMVASALGFLQQKGWNKPADCAPG